MQNEILEFPVTTSAVYSSQEKGAKKGGSSVRQFTRKQYWLVETDPDGSMHIRGLNVNHLPSGIRRPITQAELDENFLPEPQFYSQSVFPQLANLDKSIERGDSCRKKGESYSAGFEYDNALKLDENNIRANFGAGLIALGQGDAGKADTIFRRLIQLDGAFEKQHKHLFNDFGICLRKNRMYKQSIAFYRRALELTNEDENLHLNIARPLYEQGLLAACLDHLFEALRVCPGNATALKFIAWMNRGQCIPKNYEEKVASLFSKYSMCDVPQVYPDAYKACSIVLPRELDEQLSDEMPFDAGLPLYSNLPKSCPQTQTFAEWASPKEAVEEELILRQKKAARALQNALRDYASLKGIDGIVLPEELDKTLRTELKADEF